MTYPNVKVYIDFVHNALTDATGLWTDVTQWVEGVRCRHGKDGFWEQFQPGTGSLTLVNDDGRFDHTNASGPYYDSGLAFKPMRRVKVEASWPSVTALSDDFPGSAFDLTKWSQIGSGGIAVSGGNLSVTNATSTATRGLQSTVAGLTDTTITAGPFAYGYGSASVVWHPLHVVMTSGESATWQEINGSHIIRENGTVRYSTLISPTEFVYLRIRVVGRTTYWESSPDNVTWTIRHSRNTPWSDPETARVEVKAVTSGSPGGSGAMTVGKVEVVQGGNVRPLSYGWIDGWPVSQIFRKQSRVEITWHDALSLLGRTRLPDSVFEYQVASTGPYRWLRLDDTSSTAVDSSILKKHGSYRVYERFTAPWDGDLLPDSIQKEGTIDTIVPAGSKQAKNWAKLQQEVGQPPVGTSGVFPRTPAVVLDHLDSDVIQDRTFTVECWARVRQAFALGIQNNPTGSTAIRQPIFTVGAEYSETEWFEVGVNADGQMYVGGYNASGVYVELATSTVLVDGKAHHLAWASFVSGGNWTIYMYIDGSFEGSVNLSSIVIPRYGWPPVIGFAIDNSDVRGLQSSLSDVVIYDGTRSQPQILANYQAGAFGSLAGAVLTSGEAITQTLTMVGYTPPTSILAGSKVVAPGDMQGLSALDLIDQFSSAEQSPFYQQPDGTLVTLDRGWTTTLARARTVQYKLADDTTAGALGYEELDFTYGIESVVNEFAVKWAGGEVVESNTGSSSVYGVNRRSVDTKITDVADATALAGWLLATNSFPRRRVDRPLRFRPITTADFDFALDVAFGTRLQLTRTTSDGRTLVDDYWVMAVAQQVDEGQGDWVLEMTLELADDPYRAFTLDLSELDSSDVLAY